MLLLLSSFLIFCSECDLGVKNFIASGDGTIEMKEVNMVCWKYRRVQEDFLAFIEMVTDFSELVFTAVATDSDLSLVTGVNDIDKESYYHITSLQKGVTKTVTLRPTDFIHSSEVSDSSVHEGLDSRNVRTMPFFMDLLSIAKPDGSKHEICFYTNVTIRYGDLVTRKGNIQLVNEELVISDSTRIEGDIYVYESQVIVNCTRFELKGNIVLFGSSSKFILTGGGWIFHELYNHEHSILAVNGSQVNWSDGTFFIYYPYSFELYNSVAVLKNIDFLTGSYTISVDEGGSLSLDNVQKFGEVILPSKNTVRVTDSDQVLLWIRFNVSEADSFRVPSENEDFNSQDVPALKNHAISVDHSQGVKYGIILDTEGEVSIHDSEILAVGMTLGEGTNELRNIKDGVVWKDSFIHGSQQNQGIHLKNTSVGAFNFYGMNGDPTLESLVDIQDSTFGEAIVYGYSKVRVNNSLCDGKGGYFGANDNSEAEVHNSKISTLVISKGVSTMRFYSTIVEGNVAVEDGLIEFDRNCKVYGEVIKNGNGTVVFET